MSSFLFPEGLHVGKASTALWLPILVVLLPIFYVVFKAFYNLFLHPLRHYPGPKAYAMSDIPYVRMSLSGGTLPTLQKLHERYGGVVRVGPNDLSFLEPDAWKDIMGHRAHNRPEMEKDPGFYTKAFDTYSLLFSPRDVHTRFRRILSHAFSDKSMREQEPLIKQYVDLLVTRLRSNCSDGARPLNIVSWYNWTTFDIIGDLTFGEPFNCLEDSSYHPWVSMVFSGIKGLSFIRNARRFPWLLPIYNMCIPQSLIRARQSHLDMTQEKVHKRLATDTDRPDFLTFIQQKEGKNGMTTLETSANAQLLIVAGSETTATALSGATYYLLQNPEALAKLAAEVRSVFQNEDEINMQSVSQLKYMLACLEETLRMYPPVPSGFPRRVPKGGDVIHGKAVPGGTSVSIPQWVMYRSPQLFTDPNSFIPERFLGDPRFHNDVRDALQPFHIGPRNCIGKNLAIAEMRLILARIIFNFDLKLAPDSLDWDQQHTYALWEKGPLNVYLTPVQREDEKLVM